MIESW